MAKMNVAEMCEQASSLIQPRVDIAKVRIIHLKKVK